MRIIGTSGRKERWSPLRRALGEVIQSEREARRMGSRELAERSNRMPVSSLARIEGADVSASLDMICDVAQGLGWTGSELLRRAELAAGLTSGSPGTGAAALGAAELELLELLRSLAPGQQRLLVELAGELAASARHGGESEAASSEADGRTGSARSTGAPGSAEPTARHYMLAWRRETAHREADSHHPLHHIGSNQLDRPFRTIRPGDVIWAVFVEHGRLKLAGRLVVAARGELDPGLSRPDDAILSQREADRVAARRAMPGGIWRASHHVFARGRPEPSRIVELRPPAVLAFETASGAPSELRIEDQPISPQSIRSIRNLRPESASILESAWRSGSAVG